MTRAVHFSPARRGLSRRRVWLLGTCVILNACISVAEAAPPVPKSDLAAYYGFLPVEVVKLDERSSNLISGDFNHDGRTDLVLINNVHHRLDLLIQRETPPKEAEAVADADPNRITNPWRFELRKLQVDQEVAALAVGDLNGDGRDDLAYLGSPDQLVIRFQSAQGEWKDKKQIRVPDVDAGSWCIAAGDLNSDHKTDIVVLGKSDTQVLLQTTAGEFDVPVRLMNTSKKLSLVQVADLNGDGRSDLCYLAGDALSRSLGLRLQDDAGQLGAELIFDLERPRAVSVKDVDGKPGHEILVIDSRTGRLKILKLGVTTDLDEEMQSRFVRYGFGHRGSGRNRDLALGDFDGNGLTDVAVSDPEASRTLLFRQAPQRGLDLGSPYPSVAGADVLRTAKLTPGPRDDLVTHSETEKSIGISTWQDQRLSFPAALPLDIEPLGLAVVEIHGDAVPEIVFFTRDKEKKDAYSLWVYARKEDDKTWEPDPKLGGRPIGPLTLKGGPDQMLLANVTGDDRPELLVLQGSRPPLVLGWQSADKFGELTTSGSLGAGNLSASALFPCRLNDKPGLLVAQENFVRQLVLGAGNRWQVAEQFNAGEPGARIVGSALIDLVGDAEPEVAMVDAGVRKLRLLRKRDGLYQAWKEVDLGDFDFKGTRIADLNADRQPDLVLFGADQFAVLHARRTALSLEELAGYETQLEPTFALDVLAGDLNGDGRVDLALTESRSHFLELLAYQPPDRLKHALYFTVYEEKNFNREDSSGADPREGTIADVTGDGRADLILLSQDRLLVYPQDPGPPAK